MSKSRQIYKVTYTYTGQVTMLIKADSAEDAKIQAQLIGEDRTPKSIFDPMFPAMEGQVTSLEVSEDQAVKDIYLDYNEDDFDIYSESQGNDFNI